MMRAPVLGLMMLCPSIVWSLPKPSDNPCLEIPVFLGVEVDAKVASEELGYPADWTYRQVGGVQANETSKEPELRGKVAKTYLATAPGGEKIILKKYKTPERAAKDHAGMNLLSERVQKYGLTLKVAKTNISARNNLVLEVEYFPGIDMFSFYRSLDSRDSRFRAFIKAYNEQMARLQYALMDIPYPAGMRISDLAVMTVIQIVGPDKIEVRVKQDNVLISKNPNHSDVIDIVIIDNN